VQDLQSYREIRSIFERRDDHTGNSTTMSSSFGTPYDWSAHDPLFDNDLANSTCLFRNALYCVPWLRLQSTACTFSVTFGNDEHQNAPEMTYDTDFGVFNGLACEALEDRSMQTYVHLQSSIGGDLAEETYNVLQPDNIFQSPISTNANIAPFSSPSTARFPHHYSTGYTHISHDFVCVDNGTANVSVEAADNFTHNISQTFEAGSSHATMDFGRRGRYGLAQQSLPGLPRAQLHHHLLELPDPRQQMPQIESMNLPDDSGRWPNERGILAETSFSDRSCHRDTYFNFENLATRGLEASDTTSLMLSTRPGDISGIQPSELEGWPFGEPLRQNDPDEGYSVQQEERYSSKASRSTPDRSAS
jgi:hypothetical protein